jgi:hypothetical protein
MTYGDIGSLSRQGKPYAREPGHGFHGRNQPRTCTGGRRTKKTSDALRFSFGSRLSVALYACIAMLCIPALSCAGSQDPLQVGWVERVALHPGDFVIPAKVDTGAVTCSLHAPDPKVYERDGHKWVRFHLTDAEGKAITIDRPVTGTRRIKRHFGGYQERLVIKMGVCLGSLYRETEVNLVDRTGFEYPMLIGRNFMDKDLVVNPSLKNTVEPMCSQNKREAARK